MLPTIHIAGYTFYSFGLLVGLGIALSCIAFRGYFQRNHLDVNVPALCAVIVVAGFAGARLDSALLSENLGLHGLMHLSALARARSGFTYFGGMLAAIAASAIFIRACRLPLLRTLDGLFCVSLAYSLGRIGCFASGDGDYGVPTALPWGMSFPHGFVPTTVRVHPSMLYIAAWELLLFCALWKLSNPEHHALRPAGTLLGLYLLLTGAGRFFLEFLSRNPPMAIGLKEAQIVSLLLMVAGSGLLARALYLSSPQAAPMAKAIRSMVACRFFPFSAPTERNRPR